MGDKVIADDYLNDDVFLVSYPRSGNTWLRFILANLLNPDTQIDFRNIHEYSAEVDKLKYYKKNNDHFPRIIKSHLPYNESYKKIIYLVRDGRDVYVSYYFYLLNRLPAGTTFKSFLQKIPGAYGRWSEHALSWLKADLEQRIVIRYEELIDDPLSTVKQILEFSHIDTASLDIAGAIHASDFNNMEQLEKKHGRGELKTGPDEFMRKGVVGDWMNHYGEQEKQLFKQYENEALISIGYVQDRDW